MNHIRLVYAASLLAVGCLAWQPFSCRADEEPIRVGLYENQPKVFIEASGEAAGFWPELLNAIAAAEGWTVEYVPCEWENCLALLEVGALDLMLDVSYVEAREPRFDFNQEVVVSSWSVVYVREGEMLNSLVDLDQVRLGVLEDGVQYQDLSQRVKRFNIAPNFVAAPDYDIMLRWLDEGKIDAAVVNKFTGNLAESQYSIAKTNILVAPTQVHFAAPNGKNANLLQAIDEHLRALKADPDSLYYQLNDRWLAPEVPLSWDDIRQVLLLPFLAGLGSLAVAVIFWNRRLQGEIVRRKQTEAALTDSQAWLHRVLAAAEMVCWEEDLASGQVQYFGLHTPTGWQAKQWQASVEEVFQRIIHPDDMSEVRAAKEQAIAAIGEFKIEHRVILPDNRVIWVLTIGQVITDDAGCPRQVVGSSIDISDRKHAEQSLFASEEQLRLSLELTEIGTWDWRVGSDQVHWNDNHYRLMGYAPGAIEPSFRIWRQAVHPDDLDRVEQALEIALRTQTAYLEEYRVLHPDGSLHWVLGHGRTLQNDHGETVRMLGVMLDITGRKEMEEALRQSEATKQQILEAIPDLLIWMKVDGTCVGWAGGGNVANWLQPEEVIGRNHYQMLPPEISAARQEAVLAVQRTGQMQLYEQQIEVEGIRSYEEVRVVPIEADAVLIMIRNVDDRKRAELALAESEQRFRVVTENMTDLVCLHNADGRLIYITPSCRALLGYTQEELLGQSLYDFCHPQDRAQVQDSYEMTLAGQNVPVTYRFRQKSGHYIWLETITKPILDETGQILHLQTTSRDVSDRVRMEQRLRHDALHDTLTNLPNRLLLLERLDLALRRAKRHPEFQFAVLFVDCDRFKIINDSLGHSVGDQLLTAIAAKFSQIIRDTDLVARIGGDEFVFLLEEIESLNGVIQFAERLIAELRSPFFIKGQQIFMSASIGIVLGSADQGKAETLIQNADIAMYRAKRDRRSSYAIFNPEMHTQVLQHLQLENDLRQALANQAFILFYQPIVSLKTLDIVGFEVLLRWQHPALGLLTPDRFIHIVEETEMISDLGEWILLSACQQVGQWQCEISQATELGLSINLSVKQLRDTLLIPQLRKALTSTPINPMTLTLEITESLLVENIETTCDLLNQVQAMGVKISIDDFGTGYSSLSYLHQLPVDSLKIDRSFVSPPEPSLRNQTVAESIVGLSNLLDLKTIAEGIETAEQLAWLRSLHCEYGQGYLFSKPVPAAIAGRLLQSTTGFATSTQYP